MNAHSYRIVRRNGLSILVLLIFLITTVNSFVRAQADSTVYENPDWAIYENMEISILTAEGNSDLPSSFGHTNIRFRDLSKELDITMNFGAYEFGGSNFYVDFLRGNIKYNIRRQRWAYFIRRAKKEDRSLYEQILDLDNEHKYNLVKSIENYFKDDLEYRYDFFHKNCTTLTRDIIEDNQKSKIEYPNIKPDVSHRTLLDLSLTHKLWTKFGMDLILGTNTDYITSKREHMFLPRYYMDYLDEATVDGKRLVKEKKILLTASPRKNDSFINTPSFYAIILLLLEVLLLIIVISKGDKKYIRIYDRVWFVFWGGFSFFILIMWFYADHYTTDNNWNILWTNPLLLWLGFASLINKSKITIGIYWLELVFVLFCLIAWNWIPQHFNAAFIPLLLVFLMKYIRGLWPVFQNKIGKKSS